MCPQSGSAFNSGALLLLCISYPGHPLIIPGLSPSALPVVIWISTCSPQDVPLRLHFQLAEPFCFYGNMPLLKSKVAYIAPNAVICPSSFSYIFELRRKIQHTAVHGRTT